MASYPVDLDPEQIVRWLMAEREATGDLFTVRVRRTLEVRDIPPGEQAGLGDEEREDIREVATVATLEVAPIHAAEGWSLTITVEDEAGPRPPEKGLTAEGERSIDIGTFYSEFIEPGRGFADVTAEADGSVGVAHLSTLIDAIGRNLPAPRSH